MEVRKILPTWTVCPIPEPDGTTSSSLNQKTVSFPLTKPVDVTGGGMLSSLSIFRNQ